MHALSRGGLLTLDVIELILVAMQSKAWKMILVIAGFGRASLKRKRPMFHAFLAMTFSFSPWYRVYVR